MWKAIFFVGFCFSNIFIFLKKEGTGNVAFLGYTFYPTPLVMFSFLFLALVCSANTQHGAVVLSTWLRDLSKIYDLSCPGSVRAWDATKAKLLLHEKGACTKVRYVTPGSTPQNTTPQYNGRAPVPPHCVGTPTNNQKSTLTFLWSLLVYLFVLDCLVKVGTKYGSTYDRSVKH